MNTNNSIHCLKTATDQIDHKGMNFAFVVVVEVGSGTQVT